MKRTLSIGLTLVATFVVIMAAPARVEIRPSATVVMKGNSVRVTCRVPPHEENRGLYIGITNYTSSFHEITGERGPITTEQWFKLVPCEATRTFCELVDNHDTHYFAYATLEVAGCTENRGSK